MSHCPSGRELKKAAFQDLVLQNSITVGQMQLFFAKFNWKGLVTGVGGWCILAFGSLTGAVCRRRSLCPFFRFFCVCLSLLNNGINLRELCLLSCWNLRGFFGSFVFGEGCRIAIVCNGFFHLCFFALFATTSLQWWAATLEACKLKALSRAILRFSEQCFLSFTEWHFGAYEMQLCNFNWFLIVSLNK